MKPYLSTGHEDGCRSVDRPHRARVVNPDAQAPSPPGRPHGVCVRRNVLSRGQPAGLWGARQDHQGARQRRVFPKLNNPSDNDRDGGTFGIFGAGEKRTC